MLATRALPILLALLTATAHAGTSRAWTVGKTVIPPNQELVAGANLANLRSGQLFPKLLPKLVAKTGISSATLDAVKSTCGIDLVGVIDSVVVAMETADKGTLVVAIKGTTRKDLEACGGKLAAAKQTTFTATAVGALTKYSGTGYQDAFVRWLAADAFAISTQPDDKDQTLAATKGGFAGDKTMKGPMATMNTGAGVWMVAKPATDLPFTNLDPKLASVYGTINVVKGNDEVDVRGAFSDADAATALAAVIKQQLGEASKAGPMSGLLQTAAVKTTGSVIAVTASPAESDLMPLISMMGLI